MTDGAGLDCSASMPRMRNASLEHAMPPLSRCHSQLPILAIRCERDNCCARLWLAALSCSTTLYAALRRCSRRATRRNRLSSPRCSPSRPVDLASVSVVASSLPAPNRVSAVRNSATERAMRRPSSRSAAHDNASAAMPYAYALIQPVVSNGSRTAWTSATDEHRLSRKTVQERGPHLSQPPARGWLRYGLRARHLFLTQRASSFGAAVGRAHGETTR